MLFKDCLQGGGAAILELVDALDQLEDGGRHEQQIAHGPGPGIPVGVRCAARNKHARTGRNLNVFLSYAYAKASLKDVPGLIVVVVEVQRSNPTWWAGGAASIAPLGNAERVFDRAQNISGKQRCNHGLNVHGFAGGQSRRIESGRRLPTRIRIYTVDAASRRELRSETRGETQAPERAEELSSWQFWCSGSCTLWRF